MSRKALLRDVRGEVIQAFVPDPAKSVAPTATGGSLALSTVVDFSDAIAILIRADAGVTRYFNALTTKTRTIPADTDTLIYLDETVTDIVLTGAATVEIEVM